MTPHGKLVLGDTVLVGKLIEEDDEDFEFLIDGVTGVYRSNSFAKDDGWVFNEDPVQLPPKRNAVIQVHGRIPFMRSYDRDGWLVGRKEGNFLTDQEVKSTINSVGGEFKVLFEGVDE